MLYIIILLIAYAIEPYIFIDVCNRFLLKEPKEKFKKSILCFTLLYSTILVKQFFLLTKETSKFNFLSFPLIILCLYITTKIYEEKSIKNITKMILLMCIFSTLSDGLEISIIRIFYKNVSFAFATTIINALLTLFIKCIELLIYQIALKFILHNTKKHSEIEVIILYLICATSGLTIVGFLFKNIKGILYFNYSMQLIYILLITYYACSVIRQKTRNEEKAIKQVELLKQNEILTNQAMTVRDELRSLRHDMRSHFNMLIQLADQEKYEDVKDYLQYIKKEIDHSNDLCICDNMALSVIVSKYKKQARENEIDFNYVITTDTIPLSLFEQNILFDNLLSNALEANQQETITNKMIDFSVTRNIYKEIIIECSNAIEKAPLKRNGIFLTTKSDSTKHGIGFKNMMKIIKKKHGKIVDWISKDGHTFHLQITFNGVDSNENTNL